MRNRFSYFLRAPTSTDLLGVTVGAWDAFEIGVVIFLGLMVLTFVYAVARLVWRLRNDDIEPAGSDGKALTRKD